MKFSHILRAFAHTSIFIGTFGGASAQDFGIKVTDVAEIWQKSSSQVKPGSAYIAWPIPVCGPPRFKEGVCLWETPRFDLVARSYANPLMAGNIEIKWKHTGDKSNRAEQQAFNSACRSLIKAVRPDWSDREIDNANRRMFSKPSFYSPAGVNIEPEAPKRDGIAFFVENYEGGPTMCTVQAE